MTPAATAPAPPSAGLHLRPYQEQAIAAFIEGRARGLRRMAWIMPTGAGKTFTTISLARKLDAATLWLAHREELIRQPLEVVGHVWPDATTGCVKAERDDHLGKFVVGSVATLWRPDRLKKVLSRKFDLVVFDEVQHAASDANARLLEQLGCYQEGGPLLLGITATPGRSDGRALEAAFEEIVFRVGLLELIEQRHLSPFVSRQVTLEIDRANLRVGKNGDFDEADLERELLRAGAAEATARAILEHARDRHTVVFTVSVDQAERTARALVALGVRAESVSYLTKGAERQAVLARFRSGETQVVTNNFLLTEGVDVPSIDCVVMARPTKSQGLYVQGVGRGLRRYPGKTDCLILDLVGASDLGLVTAETMVRDLLAERAGKVRPEGDSAGDGAEPAEAEDGEDKRVASYLAHATGAKPRPEVAWIQVEKDSCWALGCGEQGTVVIKRVTSPLEVRDPARKFLAQLASALAAGRAHVRGINEDRCPWPKVEPLRWGWKQSSVHKIKKNGSAVSAYYAARGPRVGWVEDGDLYLDMTATRAVLRSTLENPGEVLRAAGLLVASQPGQANGAMEKTVGGKCERVFYLRAAEVLCPPASAAATGPETWAAEFLPRNRAQAPTPIGDPGALDWAFGVAEEHARALGALRLSKTDASWRGQEATPGQKTELEKRRIPCHSLWLTRGEAADLLTAATVRWRVLGK